MVRLRLSIKGARIAQLPVGLGKIRFDNGLLWIPFLLDLLLLDKAVLGLTRPHIAQLEVGRFHLPCLRISCIFGHVLARLLLDLGRFRNVVRVLLAVSDLAIGALPKWVAPLSITLRSNHRVASLRAHEALPTLNKH